MSTSAKRQPEPQFEAFDDPAKKIFEYKPGKDIIQDFLEFVKRTGKPHEWRYHLHTKPPKDAVPEIVLRFVIPESFRQKVSLAPCPICSLRFPKYWEGVLTFYPEEKALRAIGHECGREFFAEGVFDAAEAEYERRRAEQAVLDFLLPNLPKVRIARRIIKEMAPRARILDRTRTVFKTVITQKTARMLAKHAGDDKTLKFYEDRDVPLIGRNGRPMRDENGEIITHIEKTVVETLPFAGAGALSDLGYSVEAVLYSADHALEHLEVSTDDEIEAAWLSWGQAGCEDAMERIRKGWSLLEVALNHFKETQAFLHSANIENLSVWGRDSRAPFGIRCRYESQGRLELGEWGKKLRSIPIAPEVVAPLPELPPLE